MSVCVLWVQLEECEGCPHLESRCFWVCVSVCFYCFSANILRLSVLQCFSELGKIISQVLNRSVSIVLVQSGLEVHKSSH